MDNTIDNLKTAANEFFDYTNNIIDIIKNYQATITLDQSNIQLYFNNWFNTNHLSTLTKPPAHPCLIESSGINLIPEIFIKHVTVSKTDKNVFTISPPDVKLLIIKHVMALKPNKQDFDQTYYTPIGLCEKLIKLSCEYTNVNTNTPTRVDYNMELVYSLNVVGFKEVAYNTPNKQKKFITEDLFKVNEIKQPKFIISNPPYDHPDRPSYKYYVEALRNALNDVQAGGTVAMILPVTFIEGYTENAVDFRLILSHSNLVYINLNVSDHFPKIGVKIGLVIVTKERYKNQTIIEFNKTIKTINWDGGIISTSSEIHDSIITKYESLKKHDPLTLRYIAKKEKDLSSVKSKEFPLQVYFGKTKPALYTNYQSLPVKYNKHNYQVWKVIVNISGYPPYTINGDYIRISNNLIAGDNAREIRTFNNSQEEANNIATFITSTLFAYYIHNTRAGSGFVRNGFTRTWMLDATHEWNDDTVNKLFGITPEEHEYMLTRLPNS